MVANMKLINQKGHFVSGKKETWYVLYTFRPDVAIWQH
jgi:hypothetical protein